MNFRDRGYLRNMNTVYMILQEMKTQDEKLLAKLNNDTDEGLNNKLRANLSWRRIHLGVDDTFWNLHGPDNPTHVSEGVALRHEPKDQVTPLGLDMEELALSQFPAFQEAQLVRNAFRAFHRPDGNRISSPMSSFTPLLILKGYILTMSSSRGVDFLNKYIPQYIKFLPEYITDNYDASVIGFMYKLFENTGSSSWHRRTVDWFLVYLLTEVVIVPHNIRQGRSELSLMSAYQTVVQKLVGAENPCSGKIINRFGKIRSIKSMIHSSVPRRSNSRGIIFAVPTS